MKRYTVAQVRERLADALDAAARGDSVLIERRGVTFELRVRKTRRSVKPAAPLFELLDPALGEGQWSWVPGRDGLELQVAGRTKPTRRR